MQSLFNSVKECTPIGSMAPKQENLNLTLNKRSMSYSIHVGTMVVTLFIFTAFLELQVCELANFVTSLALVDTNGLGGSDSSTQSMDY